MIRNPQSAIRNTSLLAFLAVMVAACWLRFGQLDRPSLDVDEYLHVYAAMGLNATGSPVLPSGNVYDRALPFTRLVAQSFRWLGVSEFSARLPSVVIDCLTILLIFLMMRGWGAPQGAALLAAGVLALSPWWITAAKNCRMYTLFHVSYFVAAWGAWQALEGDRKRWPLWAAIAAAGLGLAFSVHELSKTFLASHAVFIVGQALVTRERRYVLLAVAGTLGAAAVIGLDLVDVGYYWRRVNQAPAWAAVHRFEWTYYLTRWWGVYPFFLAAYPLAMIWLWRRRPRLAWYLLSAGIVPFALHSLIFDWKQLRYTLYLLPWLIIPIAWALAELARSARVAAWWRERRFVTGGALAALFVASAHPWIWGAGQTVQRFPSPPWRLCYAKLQVDVAGDDAVLTTMPLSTLYYLGRPASYVLNNVHIKDGKYPAVRNGDGLYIEGYGGRPMITSVEELRRIVSTHPRGWVLVDQLRYGSKHALAPGIKEFLESHLQPVQVDGMQGASNPVHIYRWSQETPAVLHMARFEWRG